MHGMEIFRGLAQKFLINFAEPLSLSLSFSLFFSLLILVFGRVASIISPITGRCSSLLKKKIDEPGAASWMPTFCLHFPNVSQLEEMERNGGGTEGGGRKGGEGSC